MHLHVFTEYTNKLMDQLRISIISNEQPNEFKNEILIIIITFS